MYEKHAELSLLSILDCKFVFYFIEKQFKLFVCKLGNKISVKQIPKLSNSTDTCRIVIEKPQKIYIFVWTHIRTQKRNYASI